MDREELIALRDVLGLILKLPDDMRAEVASLCTPGTAKANGHDLHPRAIASPRLKPSLPAKPLPKEHRGKPFNARAADRRLLAVMADNWTPLKNLAICGDFCNLRGRAACALRKGDVMRTISYAAIISTALFAVGSSSRADTIRMFNVSGTAVNQSFVPLSPSCGARATCPFSGTLDVDVTNGTVPDIDITFPALDPFDRVIFSEMSPGAMVEATNAPSLGQVLNLTFTGSLVGFTGGTITGDVVTTSDLEVALFVVNPGGSITAAVPEPSTWAMMLLGFAGLGYAGWRGSRKAGSVAA
jgi:PEP-CTERM motif